MVSSIGVVDAIVLIAALLTEFSAPTRTDNIDLLILVTFAKGKAVQ